MRLGACSVLLVALLSCTACAANDGENAAAAGFLGLLVMLPVMLFGMFWVVWFFLIVLAVVVGLLGTVFWILMLVDCVNRKFERENDKTVWVLVIALTHLIGAGLYYIVVKRVADAGKKAVPGQ